MYAIEPSRIGSADRVAAAVNCSATNDAVCSLNPAGVVKLSKSTVLGREEEVKDFLRLK